MAVVVRLKREGKRTQPHYRIIAIDRSRGPKGAPLEVLGYYNPKMEKIKDKIHINMDRLDYWLKNGAKTSETVNSLINNLKNVKE